MRCPKCGEPNPRERLECSRCGELLPDALSDTPAPPASRDTVAPSAPAAVDTSAATVEVRGVPTLAGEAPAPTLAPQPPTLGGAFAPTQPPPPPTLGGLSDSGLGGVTGSLYRTPSPTSMPTAPSSPTASSSSGELALAAVFANRYEVVSLLGQGGMGRVYKVRDRELDKLIALKTIRSDTDAGSEAVLRFKQELLLARKITHKNVVRIHDMGEAEGIKFFTMEYIEGESLKALIRRRGRIPAAEAMPMARQILSALQEAHSQGVVHRDLKPQNIMVDKADTLHLMDFGIARSTETTGMTATGAIVGTPDYMSPEQVKGEKAGPQSDLFSFGVILYEVLTGDLPYQADTPLSKIMMRLSAKPRAPRELSAEIPKYLEHVVLKCMEVDTALRYKTAEEVLADLGREQVSRSLTLRLQRAVARRWTAFAVAVVALATAGLTYWAVTSRSKPAAAAPEGPVHTLAILPFTNAAGSKELDWMRTGLPEMLVTDLSQSRFVRPVPGERVAKVLRELGAAEQTRFDEAALESVSKRAPAESVLYGQYVESEGKLRLDMVLRKAGSGVPLPLKAEALSSQVLGLVDQITSRVKGQLDLTPEQIKGDSNRPFAELATASLEALRAYQAGLGQIRQGSHLAAIPFLKEATAKDPNFAMAYARLADAYFETGEAREAEAASDRAKTLSEKAALPLAERYHIHATAALVKDDYETAAKSYAELAKLYPADPDILFSLGSAYKELGHFPDAIEAYKKVLQLAPDYGAALIELGRAYFNGGRFPEAIATMDQALAGGKFKDDADALGTIHSVLGVSYRESKLDKALEHLNLSLDYRRKAGNKRGQAITLTNLASVYEYRGEVDKALESERKALAIAREIHDRRYESFVLNNMSLTYKVKGDLDRALAALRESVQIEMERENYQELANRLDKIADIYRIKGQYDDALVYLEQAKGHLAKTQAKEEQGLNLNYIGLVRKAQGLYDQALEAFLAALPIFKGINHEMGVGFTQHNLADIYMNQGRYADAYAALQQSLAISVKLQDQSDIAEVKGPLGHLLIVLGRLEEADKELTEAERIAKEAKAKQLLPEILLGRAELAHLRGKHEEAAKLFEEANVQANLSGQKEVAVESRIELGKLYLEQRKLAAAEALLLRTRQEAEKARLRPLEAETAAALAEVHLAKGDADSARKAALDAISIAEKYAGRPVVFEAQVLLAQALERRGRAPEALDAYAKAGLTLDWIRGSLQPEHVGTFMARRDVQAFLKTVVSKLEKGGRAAEAAALKKWIGAAPSGARAGA